MEDSGNGSETVEIDSGVNDSTTIETGGADVDAIAPDTGNAPDASNAPDTGNAPDIPTEDAEMPEVTGQNQAVADSSVDARPQDGNVEDNTTTSDFDSAVDSAPNDSESDAMNDSCTPPDGGTPDDSPSEVGGDAAGDSGTADGGPFTVIVLGLADIWLAGQPNGTTLWGGWPSEDIAPADSPAYVPVLGGTTLSILATGATSNVSSPCAGATPDGCGIADLPAGPANGLSSLAVPANALVGVFLEGFVPSGQAPAGLVMLAPNDFTTLSPLLQQVFFVGDGLTGTGNGAVQQYQVPLGATRLFLGSSDALGASYDNYGRFSVTVSTLTAGFGTSDAGAPSGDATDGLGLPDAAPDGTPE